MGLVDKVNVEVNGCGDLLSTLSTYTTKILKPNIVDGKNILTQAMISSKNIKYVIKYDYELVEDITVPKNCILEFDGGTLSNGTIIGQDTYINDVGGIGVETLFGEGITREGTWRMDEGGGSVEQIQSDWAQNDSTKKDFIKNKPNIPQVGELTERVDGIEVQVNQLIADKAVISLTGNNNVFIVGSSSVTLTASTDTEATAIRIKKGSTVLNSGSGRSLQYVDTFTKTDAGSVVYTAEFVIAGITRSVNFTIYTVNYVYYGGGNSYTDVTNLSHVASARRNVAGTYSVVVAQNGQRVFFVIPSTMTINKATMGGFDFPMDAAQTVSVDGVSYKMYRSSNTIDAGTYQIVIS